MAFLQNLIYADVDTNSDERIGFKIPFTFEPANQSLTSQEAVETNLKSLLFTSKGERVFQPNLGVNLRKHLFKQMSGPESFAAVQEDLLEQIAIWMPFLIVEGVEIDLNEENNLVTFNVTYSFKVAPEIQNSVQINVNTGASGGGY